MARFAAPIVVINVGQQLMGVVDMLMVGRLGGPALASVALGNFYFFNACIFGIGLLFALDPVVSQALGAGAHDDAARGIQRGLVMAVAIALLVTVVLWPSAAVLRALHQPTEIIDVTGVYVHNRALGVVPFLLFNSLRQSLQALRSTWPIVLAVVLANVVNVIANWLLIYGHGGFPTMGVAGSGFATALAMWSMVIMVWVFAAPVLRPYVRPWRREATAWAPLVRTLRIGVPIGTQFFFEVFAFGLTALLMGLMGTASLAAHEIALNMAAMTFMVPLGISGAAAVVVGHAVGRGDLQAARRDALAAIVCGTGFMTISAALFLAAPMWLATRYTNDAQTLAIAVLLIPLAGWFQVFDGLQAVTSGVLRGTGDTRIPAILHVVAFWGIGVPLGAFLGFETSLRERGLWIGLVAGLAAASVFQSLRVARRLNSPIARVRVDH